MEKSITGHTKHACINYIFFALHWQKVKNWLPNPYTRRLPSPKKGVIYEDNSTYCLQFSFSNFLGIQSSTLYFSYYM